MGKGRWGAGLGQREGMSRALKQAETRGIWKVRKVRVGEPRKAVVGRKASRHVTKVLSGCV